MTQTKGIDRRVRSIGRNDCIAAASLIGFIFAETAFREHVSFDFVFMLFSFSCDLSDVFNLSP